MIVVVVALTALPASVGAQQTPVWERAAPESVPQSPVAEVANPITLPATSALPESPQTETPAPAAEEAKLPFLVEDKETPLHVRLRGRIHADAIFVSQSPRDKAIIGDLQNAV